MHKSSKNIFRFVAMSAPMLACPALADDSNPSKEDISELAALAEQGNTIAQNNLGNMYHSGKGVPKDYVEAVKWYRKAAVQGQVVAQAQLALAYQTGEGVPKDDAEAVKWYRKAAVQGDDYAQVGLAAAYIAGKGGPKDYVQSYMWLSLAAAQNNKWTKFRDELEGSMTPEQIAEGQRLANEWMRQH